MIFRLRDALRHRLFSLILRRYIAADAAAADYANYQRPSTADDAAIITLLMPLLMRAAA